MPKKKSGKSGTKAGSRPGVGRVITGTASDVIDEVEKAADVVLQEIKDSFDFLTGKVTDTAKFAAKTSKEVKKKVIRKETAKHIQGLLKEVEEAGEGLLHVISGSFESWKETVQTSSGTRTRLNP